MDFRSSIGSEQLTGHGTHNPNPKPADAIATWTWRKSRFRDIDKKIYFETDITHLGFTNFSLA